MNSQIILIDDNHTELRLAKEAFQQIPGNPYEVIFFDRSPEAFGYIKQNAADIFIVICDIKMPQMTGMEMLEQINADYELKMEAIPFIFLSNSENLKEIEHAYSLAAQGYFVKPLQLEKLAKLFRTLIDYWSMATIPRGAVYSMR